MHGSLVCFITGAYGRKASLADWVAGKDFRMCDYGPYLSKRDIPSLKANGYTHIEIRSEQAGGNLIALIEL